MSNLDTLTMAGLKANLQHAQNRLKSHQAKEPRLQEEVKLVEEAIKRQGQGSFKDRCQAVFDEENFEDAIRILRDEKEILIEVRMYELMYNLLQGRLLGLGITFQ